MIEWSLGPLKIERHSIIVTIAKTEQIITESIAAGFKFQLHHPTYVAARLSTYPGTGLGGARLNANSKALAKIFDELFRLFDNLLVVIQLQ